MIAYYTATFGAGTRYAACNLAASPACGAGACSAQPARACRRGAGLALGVGAQWGAWEQRRHAVLVAARLPRTAHPPACRPAVLRLPGLPGLDRGAQPQAERHVRAGRGTVPWGRGQGRMRSRARGPGPSCNLAALQLTATRNSTLSLMPAAAWSASPVPSAPGPWWGPRAGPAAPAGRARLARPAATPPRSWAATRLSRCGARCRGARWWGARCRGGLAGGGLADRGPVGAGLAGVAFRWAFLRPHVVAPGSRGTEADMRGPSASPPADPHLPGRRQPRGLPAPAPPLVRAALSAPQAAPLAAWCRGAPEPAGWLVSGPLLFVVAELMAAPGYPSLCGLHCSYIHPHWCGGTLVTPFGAQMRGSNTLVSLTARQSSALLPRRRRAHRC